MGRDFDLSRQRVELVAAGSDEGKEGRREGGFADDELEAAGPRESRDANEESEESEEDEQA